MSTIQRPTTETSAPRFSANAIPIERWNAPERIIIATDGSERSDAAVVVGRALARREVREPELLTVFERPIAYDVPISLGLTALEIELAAKQDWWRGIEEQRRRVAPAATRWPVTFEEGSVASEVAMHARARENAIVILGLGAHGLMERTIGRETALDVIRESAAPVLAVHPEMKRLPTTAVVALDFSPASIEAARVALHLLGESGTLYLVRVRTPDEVADEDALDAPMPDEMATRLLFGAVRRALGAPAGVTMEPVLLYGDPARAVLAFAAEQDADLIACGMHRYSRLERIIVGSVSTRILRNAHCSVLVAPPAEDE